MCCLVLWGDCTDPVATTEPSDAAAASAGMLASLSGVSAADSASGSGVAREK